MLSSLDSLYDLFPTSVYKVPMVNDCPGSSSESTVIVSIENMIEQIRQSRFHVSKSRSSFLKSLFVEPLIYYNNMADIWRMDFYQ